MPPLSRKYKRQTSNYSMLRSRWRHLFQHVLQPLGLQVDDELLLLSPVQILQQPSVVCVGEAFDADGADLPVVLSRLLHDGLQDSVSCDGQKEKSRQRGREGRGGDNTSGTARLLTTREYLFTYWVIMQRYGNYAPSVVVRMLINQL